MPVSIALAEFYAYRVPLTSPFVWALGTVKSATNIVTILHGECDGRAISGRGELAPRGPGLTGDDWNGIPRTMVIAAERLIGLTLPHEPRTTVEFIASFMASLNKQIRVAFGKTRSAKLFRGCLSGIEMALLDLAALAHGLSVADLLGAKRSEVRVSHQTFAEANTQEQVADIFKNEVARFPLYRLKGSGGDGSEDVNRLLIIAERCFELGLACGLWIDINGAFSGDAAHKFIDQVASLSRSGRLPKQLIIEQPVPRPDLQALAALQDHADELAAGYAGDIAIMADEFVWDRADLEALHRAGGCRALNLKIQKAGGLIEALRTAELSDAQDPSRRIQIGGFPGTSDIAAWAAINLGRVLPRLDYFGAAPPSLVAHRIATPLCRFADDTSNVLAEQAGPGLGVEIDLNALRPLVMGHHRVPKDF